jgi:hypothetical protein
MTLINMSDYAYRTRLSPVALIYFCKYLYNQKIMNNEIFSY